MAKLVGNQAKTLLEIVKFSRKTGWKLPTAKELALLLGVGERAAAARMKRLFTNQPNCFVLHGRSKLLNPEMLATEKESAAFLMEVYNIASKIETGRIPKQQIARSIGKLSLDEAELYLKAACSSGYMEMVLACPHEVRLGPKTFDHIEYLSLLAEA